MRETAMLQVRMKRDSICIKADRGMLTLTHTGMNTHRHTHTMCLADGAGP